MNKILHGGDYNPEQWLDMPEILETDIERFKQAKINTVTLGVFSWAKLEPREGEFHFEWLEQIVDRLYENGISVIMATPSGARPHWLADQYPEVYRVDAMRQRAIFGRRHNHCLTSPAYREKVRRIDTELVKRFKDHPAVLMWHISNELGGDCHCPLCQNAFRDWLKKKYGTIENLNAAWCTTFWSHTYDHFEQVESPSPIGENSVMALDLDYRRFVSDQTIDFMVKEIEAIREAGGKQPATTNLMYHFGGIDYYRLAEKVDLVSWDSYPVWGKKPNAVVAEDTAFWHDVIRGLKRQPFVLMESCPGQTNWQGVSKLRKPGIVKAASFQSIAHGADGALYFQMRQSRGAEEKFHAAVIDHYGKTDSRTYQEVCETGEMLSAISEVKGLHLPADVAVIYDWDNRWAQELSCGPRHDNMYYEETVEKSYYALRRCGCNVDVIDQSFDFDRYQFVAAPMQYLFHPGFSAKIRNYVEQGGTLVMTYWSGVVDENDKCFLGETPYELTDVLGLRREEIDGLYDFEENAVVKKNEISPKAQKSTQEVEPDCLKGMKQSYVCKNLCELVKPTTAKPLMYYASDFYAGRPALLENDFKKGKVYYICADMEQAFYDDFYRNILKSLHMEFPLPQPVPAGVDVSVRENDKVRYTMITNFSDREQMIETSGTKVIYGPQNGVMKPLDSMILRTDQ